MNNIIFNYDNNIINNNNEKKLDFYYNNKNITAGRGFGNLNISNEIRNANSSRFRENKIENEKIQMFDYKFQYLDKNIQDPDHLIMPIPRGGESTRKNNNNININNNNIYNFSYN